MKGLPQRMHKKIKTFEELLICLASDKKKGFKIAHCHGVFDLIHPGHLRHLQEAKNQGDKLVVSLTPDCFVNKGPGRPAFSENLRLEQVASLQCVDYVVLNDSPDAVSAIQKIGPHVYVKGMEYHDHQADVTGKISAEVKAAQNCGGKVHYTNDIVFSSSSLLNKYFDPEANRLNPFLEQLKKTFSIAEVIKKIDAFANMNVLVIGDAIVDEYQYASPLGQSGKGVHMTVRCLDKEIFLGGSLIIANHLAEFVKKVTLLTAVGKDCPYLPFIHSKLAANVAPNFIHIDRQSTLNKKRYVLKDGKTLTKLFETYSSNDLLLNAEQTEDVVRYLQVNAHHYDLILVCDFGNGFTNPRLVDAISDAPGFLAVNTQTNSGNRGFNVVTHYRRADFISLNEPELRLAAQDRYSPIESLAHDISELMKCPHISVTRGVEGVFYYSSHSPPTTVPALTTQAIDRIGAGDSYFSLASLCAAKGYSPLLSGFLGSVAAAMDVQIVGNRESISKAGVCKYVTRLFK